MKYHSVLNNDMREKHVHNQRGGRLIAITTDLILITERPLNLPGLLYQGLLRSV